MNKLWALLRALVGKSKLPDTITVRKHVGPWEGTSSVLRGTTDGIHPEFKPPGTFEPMPYHPENNRYPNASPMLQDLEDSEHLAFAHIRESAQQAKDDPEGWLERVRQSDHDLREMYPPVDMEKIMEALNTVEFQSYNLKDVAERTPMHTKADFKPGEFARIFEQVHQTRLDKKEEQTPPVPKLTYDETFFHQRNHLDKETARLVIKDPELYYWLTGETLEDARAHVQRILADRHVMDTDTAEALVDRACEQFRNRTKPEKVLMVVDSIGHLNTEVLRRLSEKMPMVLVGAGSGLNFDDEMTKRTLAQFDKIHAVEPMPIVEKPWIEMNQPQYGRRKKKKQSSDARRKRKAGHSDGF